MPITLELREDGHVMLCAYNEPMYLSDLYELEHNQEEIYGKATHKVHMIVDLQGLRSVPPGTLRVRGHSSLTHPNSGHIAVIGASTLTRTIAETVLRLVHFPRAKFFTTEEEAWTYLRHVIAEEQHPAS